MRAFVHRADERSRHLSELGAEAVVGDFHDLPSLRAAMIGIKRVYFCYPPQGDRLLEAAANVAIAARDEGVEALVNMSQINAREDAPSPLSFQHWQSEHVFDWAGTAAEERLLARRQLPRLDVRFPVNLVRFESERRPSNGEVRLSPDFFRFTAGSGPCWRCGGSDRRLLAWGIIAPPFSCAGARA